MTTILDQDQVWGHHDLTTMDPDHRANLIPFLRGNLTALWRSQEGPDAEAPDRAALEGWLEQKPLMRRLVDLERGRPLEDRRASDMRNRAYEAETGYQKVRFG